MDVGTKEYKEKKMEELRKLDIKEYGLGDIEPRLYDYVEEVQLHAEDHNLYEILSVLKFLRMLRIYEFRKEMLARFVVLYESLKFSGLKGRRKYKLTSVQVFQFAGILGFYSWEDVGEADEEDTTSYKCLSAEEKEWVKIERGRKYELRRVVRKVILFVARKFSKTTSTAALAVDDFLFGDANAQAYTAANSYKQAKICFEEISKIMRQLDGKKKYFKSTRETLKWKENKFGKESTVECLTGGGDTKDGLNASLVIFDEYAQARYVKGHSEGAELMQVLTSSMGTRREPLVVIITTASRVEDGPFAIELANAKKVLEGEYLDDRQFASLFMPDAWEMSGDALGDRKVWKKCNPHIGITVQEDFYKKMWDDAQHDAEAMIEFKTKLLNIFVNGNVKEWIPQSLIRMLQGDYSMERVNGRPETMMALDLSVSDDLSAVVYNSYSRSERKFYIDMDCYIPEETLETHQNRELYKYWVKNGWMKVCKGKVIDSTMIVEDVLRRNEKLLILQIGYDAYKAQEVVNALRAAISATADPDKILKAVPQTYGAFTSPVETFELSAKMVPARVTFSRNPIFSYCFANCYLDEDKMGNKKPLKQKENLKIDAAITTLMTFWLYNNYEY